MHKAPHIECELHLSRRTQFNANPTAIHRFYLATCSLYRTKFVFAKRSGLQNDGSSLDRIGVDQRHRGTVCSDGAHQRGDVFGQPRAPLSQIGRAHV